MLKKYTDKGGAEVKILDYAKPQDLEEALSF